MSKEIALMREAISGITRILSNKNITVTQRGYKAEVHYNNKGVPTGVTLPELPDSAPPELIDAVRGFLDTQVGRLVFSDGRVSQAAATSGVNGLFKVLEGLWVEKEMQKKFPGSADNMKRVSQFALDTIYQPRLEELQAQGASPSKLFKKCLAVPAMRALAGETASKVWMDGKWELIESVIEKMAPEFKARLAKVRSSYDALDMAHAVNALLEKDNDPKDKNGDPDEDQDGDGGGEGGSSGGGGGGCSSGKGNSEPQPEKPKNEEKEDDDQNDSEGEGDTDEDDQNEDEEEEPAESEGDSEDKSEDQDDQGGSDSSGDGEPEASDPGETGGIGGGAGSDEIRDLGDELGDKIAQQSLNEIAKCDYVVYTRAYDKFIKSTDAEVDKMIKRGKEHYGTDYVQSLSNQVDQLVGVVKSKLERAVEAKSMSQYIGGHRSGRINSQALHRIKTDDFRVFRRLEESNSKDTAIELVIDMSGSMHGGNRFTNAVLAAYGLASAMNRLNVKFEVVGFTTSNDMSSEDMNAMQEMSHKLQSMNGGKGGIARYESIVMPVIKDFDEGMGIQCMRRFASFLSPDGQRVSRNNIDGESVRMAGDRLMKQKAERRIMMVLSDGYPAGASLCVTDAGYADGRSVFNMDLKNAIQDLTKKGVQVIGIGMDSDAVRDFYPRSVVLKNINELGGTILDEVKSMLLS